MVFGLADEKWGETVNAAVVLHPGRSVHADDLKAFCRKHMARYKVPKTIFFNNSLPKNPYGKIVKQKVIELCVPKGR